MKWLSSNIRLLSSKLYPIRKLLLASWIVPIIVVNLLNVYENTSTPAAFNLLVMWPLCLWGVTFVWGHSEENKTPKVQLFMLPFAASVVIGLFLLVPLTLLLIFQAFVQP